MLIITLLAGWLIPHPLDGPACVDDAPHVCAPGGVQ
jgi:hypothetical protein